MYVQVQTSINISIPMYNKQITGIVPSETRVLMTAYVNQPFL